MFLLTFGSYIRPRKRNTTDFLLFANVSFESLNIYVSLGLSRDQKISKEPWRRGYIQEREEKAQWYKGCRRIVTTKNLGKD